MLSTPSKTTLPALALLFASFNVAIAQSSQQTFPATPLASKRFSYPTGIPYKVDTDDNLIRGRQIGYNICNGTTEGPESLCQTSFLNALDDFCLWAPPEPNSIVGDVEGGMVAWCTKAGHGTRLIPAGALTGVQFIRAPSYVSVVGYIDQTKINIAAGDYGGEMDPHGADLRGNPLGGLLFTNAFGNSNTSYTQVIEWHNFIGADFFCLKACDPSDSDDDRYCEHVFDRIGCAYNVPNRAQNGTFETCDGENQDFPGIYTENGQVMTYTQPAESLGAITTMPYTARVPASSNCVSYSSEVIYLAASTAVQTSSSSAPTGQTSTSGTGTRTSSAPSSSASSGSSESDSNDSNGATGVMVSGITLLGIVFSAIFFS